MGRGRVRSRAEAGRAGRLKTRAPARRRTPARGTDSAVRGVARGVERRARVGDRISSRWGLARRVGTGGRRPAPRARAGARDSKKRAHRDADGIARKRDDGRRVRGTHLAEAAEALGVDGGLMDENLVGAVVGGDEPEALLGVEPLHLRRERVAGEERIAEVSHMAPAGFGPRCHFPRSDAARLAPRVIARECAPCQSVWSS